jgi:hypothetical protein
MRLDVDLSRLNETEAGMFTYLAIKAMGHDPDRLFRTFVDLLQEHEPGEIDGPSAVHMAFDRYQYDAEMSAKVKRAKALSAARIKAENGKPLTGVKGKKSDHD